MNLSDNRWTSVSAYTQRLASLMNLDHWRIIVKKEYEDQVRGFAVAASCDVRKDSAVLNLWYGQRYFEESPEEQRNTTCHELLHAHVDEIYQYAFGGEAIKNFMPQATLYLWEEGARGIMERTVDQMANGWAPLLPLPPRFYK